MNERGEPAFFFPGGTAAAAILHRGSIRLNLDHLYRLAGGPAGLTIIA
jgi:hypothetical protein